MSLSIKQRKLRSLLKALQRKFKKNGLFGAKKELNEIDVKPPATVSFSDDKKPLFTSKPAGGLFAKSSNLSSTGLFAASSDTANKNNPFGVNATKPPSSSLFSIKSVFDKFSSSNTNEKVYQDLTKNSKTPVVEERKYNKILSNQTYSYSVDISSLYNRNDSYGEYDCSEDYKWEFDENIDLTKASSDDIDHIISLKRVIHCYFYVIQKSLKTEIPKCITYYLVEKTLKMVKDVMYKAYDEYGDKDFLVSENDDAQVKRENAERIIHQLTIAKDHIIATKKYHLDT